MLSIFLLNLLRVWKTRKLSFIFHVLTSNYTEFELYLTRCFESKRSDTNWTEYLSTITSTGKIK